MREIRAWTLLYASVAYVLIGVVTAWLAGAASSPGSRQGWRLLAWLLSLAVFAMHFASERRRHERALDVAARVGLAVALGALGLAAIGPVRAHWGGPSRFKLALLSLLAWPLLTGLPAFVVALISGSLLDRMRAPTQQSASR